VENLDGCFADPGATSGDDDVFALQLRVKFFSVDCDRCHGFDIAFVSILTSELRFRYIFDIPQGDRGMQLYTRVGSSLVRKVRSSLPEFGNRIGIWSSFMWGKSRYLVGLSMTLR
jgi:hypothetical protein